MEPSRLFVENQFGRHIDVWTREGDFVERHTVQEKIGGADLVGFADNHLILSEVASGDEPQRIHVLDSTSWERAHRVPLNLNLDLPEGLGTSGSVTTIGDSIYTSRVTEYALYQYAIDSTLGRVIERDVDVLVGPGAYTSGGRAGLRLYSHLSAGSPIQRDGSHRLRF